MKKILCALGVGLFTLALSTAYAASDEYKAAKKQEEAHYKMAKADCKKLTGAEERSCKKTAKADHEAAEKRLKAMK